MAAMRCWPFPLHLWSKERLFNVWYEVKALINSEYSVFHLIGYSVAMLGEEESCLLSCH